MNLIEQATERLEELARAGVTIPWAAIRDDEEKSGRAVPVRDPQVADPLASDGEPGARLRGEPAARVELDFEGLRQAGVLAPEQDRSRITHQFRQIKQPLLANARPKLGEPAHLGSLIMVTSSLPNEGKTFCAINLAISLAMEVDTSVLLVDADLIRPSLFSRLGLKIAVPGLLDLLTRDDLQVHEALVATDIPKLFLMTSGDRNKRSTEFLVSASMDRLLARLSTEYADHLIIFDAPPLLLTTDSSVLASKVGQVVVVVEAGRTPRARIAESFASLRSCPIVLSILNKCESSGDDKRSAYQYYE